MKQKKEKKTKVINPNKRAIVWKISDKVVSISPLVILAIVQWKEYFGTTTKTGLSNGIGLGLLGIYIAIIISKKSDFIKGTGGFIMVFAICFFLRAILNDLVLITGTACIGQIISSLWTRPKQLKWERIKDKEETAEIGARYMKQTLSEGSDISGRC